MKRISKLEDCHDKNIKEIKIQEGIYIRICLIFTDDSYCILEETCAGHVSYNDDIHFTTLYEFGLISNKKYRELMCEENNKQNEIKYKRDMEIYNRIKVEYNL
jgi:hypothetical protein